jgi:hypothetical protein
MRFPWRKETAQQPSASDWEISGEDTWTAAGLMNAFHFDWRAANELPRDLQGFLHGYVAQGSEQERRDLFSIRNSGDIWPDFARYRYYGRWWTDPDGAREDLRRWMTGAPGSLEPPCERVREITRGRSPDDAAVLAAEHMRLPIREQDGMWVVDETRTAELLKTGEAHEREVGEAMVARAQSARRQWLYEHDSDGDCIDETPYSDEVYATFPSF